MRLPDRLAALSRRTRIALAAAIVAAAAAALALLLSRIGTLGFGTGELQRIVLRLLTAGIAFAAIVTATRYLVGLMRAKVLTAERIDPGIAYSIERMLGYAGLALAALIAASVSGFDLSGLTIVAGALSVGVGFGLQNVISNFVCGLIVLFERPVKVGDWVVVKGQEGIVKRINVRATELETFDKASVLVPNSELITSPLLNWTHGSAIGSVAIKVSVAAESDPAGVHAALLAAARAHPGVLADPPPKTVFDDFGADGLLFSLRVHVADIRKGGGVRSELRALVLEGFRAAGIAIPAPQREVRIGAEAMALLAAGARKG